MKSPVRNLVIAVLLSLALVAPLYAVEGLTVLPSEVGAITMYDLEVVDAVVDEDGNVVEKARKGGLKVGLRYPALNYQEILFLDGAVITDFEETAVAVGLNIEIVALARLLGLNVTLAENFHVGFLGGWNFKSEESPKPVWGPFAGVQIKF